MKWEPFEFRQIQNFRTLAIIAKRDGVTDIESLISRLDNYIAKKNLEIKRDGKLQEAQITTGYTRADKKQIKEQKRQEQAWKKETIRTHKEKLAGSTQCPECEQGRVIDEVREGIAVRTCTHPQMFGNFIKFESGCGYSRMVD